LEDDEEFLCTKGFSSSGLAPTSHSLRTHPTGDSVLYNDHHAEAGFALLSN